MSVDDLESDFRLERDVEQVLLHVLIVQEFRSLAVEDVMNAAHEVARDVDILIGSFRIHREDVRARIEQTNQRALLGNAQRLGSDGDWARVKCLFTEEGFLEDLLALFEIGGGVFNCAVGHVHIFIYYTGVRFGCFCA